MTTDCSCDVPAVGNPEYFGEGASEPWTAAAGATADVTEDSGNYLTCGAAANDYYDHSLGQLITA